MHSRTFAALAVSALATLTLVACESDETDDAADEDRDPARDESDDDESDDDESDDDESDDGESDDDESDDDESDDDAASEAGAHVDAGDSGGVVESDAGETGSDDGQADASTSGGDIESSAGQLPTGGDTVLIAEGEWNGMPLSFECQSSQHEFPRLQYFWQNAGLPLYQIRCRTTDDEYQVWFDQAGEAVQQYDYPLGEPVDGGIGFGSLSGAMLNQHAESKVVNRVTVSSFVADERIEGSFEASWEGGDDEGFISGVFRVAPKPE